MTLILAWFTTALTIAALVCGVAVLRAPSIKEPPAIVWGRRCLLAGHTLLALRLVYVCMGGNAPGTGIVATPGLIALILLMFGMLVINLARVLEADLGDVCKDCPYVGEGRA